MKILVITRNAWDDTNAIGNTLSNFFSGIDDVEFANIYFRSASPYNQICREYYCVTETEVLKKYFSPQNIGKYFKFDLSMTPKSLTHAQKKENKIVQFVRDHNLQFVYWLSDRIWYGKKWQNKRLALFVESFNPDLVVSFVKSAPQYYLTVKYLRENYNIPLFSWIADDEYTGLLKKNAKREIRNLRYIVNESTVVRGCSIEVCDYYNKVFGCNASPLYKSCNLQISKATNAVSDPVTIVYAGNLLYGRLDIVRQVASTINNLSLNNRKISFEIYSNTMLPSQKIEDYFAGKECVKYMGKRDYEYIKERLSNADIALHVESFETEQVLKTQYSFSTKIVDYLQSGSVLLAIGPEKVASIKYVKRIPGACVVDNLENLQNELKLLIEDVDNFEKRISEIKLFAQNNHNPIATSKELKEIFSRMTDGGV